MTTSRASRIIAGIMITVVLLWIAGWFLSDRFAWSQWLSWIPTLSVSAVLIAGSGFALAARQRCWAVLAAVLGVTALGWWAFAENRLFQDRDGAGDVRLVAWTMSHSKARSREHAEEVIRLDGDITVMTHGYIVRGEPALKEWLGPRGKRLINGPFTVLTRFRAVEVQTLIASDGVHLSVFVLGTKKELGRHLVLWAIDLPSEFNESRIATARRVRRILSRIDAPLPDIVVGDFNMERNSAAIKVMFPALTDAWDEAGSGLSSSYHRVLPLYHIDHMLLGPSVAAVSYRLVNPGIGRHRVQVAELVSN